MLHAAIVHQRQHVVTVLDQIAVLHVQTLSHVVLAIQTRVAMHHAVHVALLK